MLPTYHIAIIDIIVIIRCPSLSFPSSLFSTGPQPHLFPGLSLVPYRYDPAKLPECALANRQFWIICAFIFIYALLTFNLYWACNVSDNCTTSPFAFKMPPTLPIPSGSTTSKQRFQKWKWKFISQKRSRKWKWKRKWLGIGEFLNKPPKISEHFENWRRPNDDLNPKRINQSG